MTIIHVEGRPYEVQQTENNLLQTLLTLGFNVPYFCWHPALGAVGACRQCAVKVYKDKNDTRGQLAMSCMTPVKDGMLVSVDDAAAKHFRKSVIEWLMLNHPHDCPVCDEGGHCHLQDMTVLTGHNYRLTRFPKRTHHNQDLGPFIHHEMNRCIQCYRCVRFYHEYAGGKDLAPLGAHHHVYFGRDVSGTLENEFAGNLIEVCPTGVFTDKPARARYARKWDLTMSPSICLHCGLGCNTIISARDDHIVRVENRYHQAINGYFLCDRGRFARDFVESEKRIRRPLVRVTGSAERQPTAPEKALAQAAEAVKKGAIGVGSPRASLETNFALRELVGADHFCLGLSADEAKLAAMELQILTDSPVPIFSLKDIEEAEAVLILGEDVSNTAPRLALSLYQTARRQPARVASACGIPAWQAHSIADAIQEHHGPIFSATSSATRIDEIASRTYHAAPDDIARLGFAVAAALEQELPSLADLPPEVATLAEEIADTLKTAQRAVVIAGLSLRSEPILHAAAQVVRSLHNAGGEVGICLIPPEANTFGLAMLGGMSMEALFSQAKQNKIENIVVVENDLYRRAAKNEVDEFFRAIKNVVVIDCIETPTTMKADVLLPAATYAEGNGTLVNHEGRAQRFFRVLPPQAEIKESWRWLGLLAGNAGNSSLPVDLNLDQLTSVLAAGAPQFSGLINVAPGADFRLLNQRIPHEPSRFSGRTAITANIEIHEPKPPVDPDSAFVFSMEGYSGPPPPVLMSFYWSPHWNSVQALNKFQAEVGGTLRGGDPGLRLLEKKDPINSFPSSTPPPFFVPRPGRWLLLPINCIFGSEELSALSPPIAARAPKPFVAMNLEAAQSIGAAPGEFLVVQVAAESLRLPLVIRPSMPRGAAGLWAGSGSAALRLPAWAEIAKEPAS